MFAKIAVGLAIAASMCVVAFLAACQPTPQTMDARIATIHYRPAHRSDRKALQQGMLLHLLSAYMAVRTADD